MHRSLWNIGVVALMLLGSPVWAADDEAAQRLNFANAFFQRSFFEEAVEEYTAYIEAVGEASVPLEVWYHLGEAAYAAKDYERALMAFDRLQSAGESEWRNKAQLSQGEVQYFLKEYDKTIATLTSLADPAQPETIRARAIYYLGKAHFEKGQFSDAVTFFARLTEELPENPLAPYGSFQLAYTYLAQGKQEDAAMQFSVVAGSEADAALRMESQFRAAQAYDEIGWYKAALGAYEALRDEFPDAPFAEEAGMGLIWASFHEGKCAEAEVAIDAHLKRFPASTQVVELEYIRANCLQQRGKNDEALDRLTKIRSTYPDSPFAGRALYKMAWIEYLNQNMEQARTLVTQFLQEYKDSDLVGEGAFLLGTIFVFQGDYEDAQQEFRLVAERYPDSEFGAEAQFKSGECLEQLGMTDAAAQTFEAFVTRYPDHALTAQAMLRAGDARFAASAFDEAVARYTKILETPTDPNVEEQVLYRLGLTYHNMKDYENSAKTLNTLLEKFPESLHREEALFRVAEHALKVAEEPIDAVARYKDLIALAPEGEYAGRAHLGLALAHYAHKDYSEAAQIFYSIMTTMPAISLTEEVYNWTGQWFYDNERWAEAVRTFEVFLEVMPSYPYGDQIRFKMAECSEKSGDIEKAIERYSALADSESVSDLSTQARWQLAKIYEAREDKESAIRWYEATASSGDGDIAARARFQLGVLYEAQEDYAKAARSFMLIDILFIHEELSPEALWRAGNCYKKLDQLDKSKKVYADLIEGYPESSFAAQAREALAADGAS